MSELFPEITQGDGQCVFRIRTGLPFPGQFQPWIRQPYINNFFLSLPYQGIVNMLITIGDTIKGRVENIIKLFKKPDNTGELIQNITLAIRDLATLADEVLYYINIFRNPEMIPTVYIDPELPLGFYVAISIPIKPSEYDVAKNALLLDRLLYQPGNPKARMFVKQVNNDESYEMPSNPIVEKAKKKIKEQIKDYIKNQLNLPDRLQQVTQGILDINQLWDYSHLKGLSIYDSVFFYWKGHVAEDLTIDANRVRSFLDLETRIIRAGSDIFTTRVDDNTDAIVTKVPEDRLYTIRETVQDTDEDEYKDRFLGISKNNDYKTISKYTQQLINVAFGVMRPRDIKTQHIYQWFGLMYVPLLPYRDTRPKSLVDKTMYDNPQLVVKDYKRYRDLQDELLESYMTNQNIEDVKKRMKKYISQSECLREELVDAGLTITEEHIVTNEEIAAEESNRQEGIIGQLSNIPSVGQNLPTTTTTNVIASELNYVPKVTKFIDPNTRDLDQSSNFAEKVAYYSISKAKFIKEFISTGQINNNNRDITVKDYADYLSKIFFGGNDSLVSMLNYLRNYYDSFREAAAGSAIVYNMGITDEYVKDMTEYFNRTGDEKELKELREIVEAYCNDPKNNQDREEVKDLLSMPERIQGRMPIVEDIVSESVFKAFIYYQLINALVGTSVSNTTHYIVSLEPFTEHIPNLPLLVKLDFDDMQRELFATVAGTDRYEKIMRDYPNISLTKGGFSIYRDFLPIKSLSVEYEDIETASIEIFGFSFSVPGSWNSLKPQISIEVHDFAGRPFARYMQTYRKLVFRNNGTWPIMHMAFILDIVGIDNTLTITDLMSLLVVPRSINIPAIDYDSSEDFTTPQPVRIDFEVIGFVDYVDTALINGAAVGKFNVIDHISFNRIADPNNILSNWYHTQNFNPAPAKYALYSRNYDKHLALRDIRKCRLMDMRMRTGRTAHLVEGDPQIRNIKVFEPEIGGRSTDWAYKPREKR
jgi:hypothetical protein